MRGMHISLTGWQIRDLRNLVDGSHGTSSVPMLHRHMHRALRPVLRAQPRLSPMSIPPLAGLQRALATEATTTRVTESGRVGDALLIKVSGQDHPGITARFTEMLHESGSEFFDVDQAIVHDNLSLYFLVGMPTSSEKESSFIHNVLDKSKRENVTVTFEVVCRKDLVESVAAKVPEGLVVTLLKDGLGFKEIAAVARTSSDAGFNISKIRRLSNLEQSLELPTTSAVEMLVEPVSSSTTLRPAHASDRRLQLREALMELRGQLECDVALQRETLLRRSKRLVVLDMDSTLIQQEVDDYMMII